MGYSKFGEFIRILRIKHHEVMGDTAKLLGCTVSFVSSVESGRKNVPDSWVPILIEHYNLTPDEQNELTNVIEASKTQIKLNLASVSEPQRRLAVQFQRSFEKLDEETAKAIFELLSKEDS